MRISSDVVWGWSNEDAKTELTKELTKQCEKPGPITDSLTNLRLYTILTRKVCSENRLISLWKTLQIWKSDFCSILLSKWHFNGEFWDKKNHEIPISRYLKFEHSGNQAKEA